MNMENTVNKFDFNYHVFKRICIIMMRKSKKISMLYVDYTTTASGNDNEVEIKYRFRNALWFTANDKKTLANRIAFPKQQDGKEVKITVQGLFRKQEYSFRLMNDHIIKLK